MTSDLWTTSAWSATFTGTKYGDIEATVSIRRDTEPSWMAEAYSDGEETLFYNGSFESRDDAIEGVIRFIESIKE